MAIDRRTFLLAVGASALPYSVTLADLANPAAFISARRDPQGFSVALLDESGAVLHSERLPARGHGTAISPDLKTAVLFARRPGSFAMVIDLVTPASVRLITPRPDRHFFGHGFFSPNGTLLYATENDFDAARGVIGIYDVATGYQRIGEIDTHGVGPHQCILKKDGRTIVVANGGIETHPDYPREKLNLATMEPSLVYLDRISGEKLDQAMVPEELHQLSIRHIDEAGDGAIWIGGQYHGPGTDDVPLIATHQQGQELTFIPAADEIYRSMKHYVGSVTAYDKGAFVVTTSPRGGRLLVWDTVRRRLIDNLAIADVCGVAANGSRYLASDGNGGMWDGSRANHHSPATSWDNHMKQIAN